MNNRLAIYSLAKYDTRLSTAHGKGMSLPYAEQCPTEGFNVQVTVHRDKFLQ